MHLRGALFLNMLLGFLNPAWLDYNLNMLFRRLRSGFFLSFKWLSAALLAGFSPALAQTPPRSPAGRILLLPRTMVSGDRATLAVLDVNGRLTAHAQVIFSNGDRLTTNATGRALFVAPLNPGVIYGSIAGRPGRVPVKILPTSETTETAIKVATIPEIVSLTDRLEIDGSGFCGDADKNRAMISGEPAFVLASSPTSLVLLPAADLPPGRASVDLSCGKRTGPPLEVVFVALSLEADTSPLLPGAHRQLTVEVRGIRAKVRLEARNLAPEIAELSGGNPARVLSSGGAENLAHFEVVGRKRGSFLISIHLLSPRSISH
ncbi:MAG: hypothetical protein ACRD51_02245 [Candidatus Acidiferrum sp.]